MIKTNILRSTYTVNINFNEENKTASDIANTLETSQYSDNNAVTKDMSSLNKSDTILQSQQNVKKTVICKFYNTASKSIQSNSIYNSASTSSANSISSVPSFKSSENSRIPAVSEKTKYSSDKSNFIISTNQFKQNVLNRNIFYSNQQFSKKFLSICNLSLKANNKDEDLNFGSKENLYNTTEKNYCNQIRLEPGLLIKKSFFSNSIQGWLFVL